MFLQKKKMKITAATLSILLLGCSIPNSIYASEYMNDTSIQSYNQNISKAAQNLEKYVTLENNQYKLNLPSDINNKIDSTQLQIYKEYINTMNSIIIENNIQNVSLENGFTLEISDNYCKQVAKEQGIKDSDNKISPINNSFKSKKRMAYSFAARRSSNGISKFRWTKGGFDWWLTGYQAGLVVAAGGGGASFLCGLIPGIGWAAAASIATSMATFAAANSVSHGVKISYRFQKYLRITPQ